MTCSQLARSVLIVKTSWLGYVFHYVFFWFKHKKSGLPQANPHKTVIHCLCVNILFGSCLLVVSQDDFSRVRLTCRGHIGPVWAFLASLIHFNSTARRKKKKKRTKNSTSLSKFVVWRGDLLCCSHRAYIFIIIPKKNKNYVILKV